jgi:aminoethylphosphonate catabolism LysR family transcriptional regulator
MNSTQIRAFHSVAVHKGFSAAARAENISQPTLSAQIKELEERYGIELFHRVGRSVQLSIAGQQLFLLTSRLSQQATEIDEFLNSFKGMHTGTLRIAAVGPFHATDMIAAFKLRYPKLDVTVQLANSQKSFERLLAYEADVGLIAEVKIDPRVTTTSYSEHEVVIFVHERHPFFERKSIAIDELDGEWVILREQGSTTRIAMERALAARGVTVKPVLEIGSREGVWKADEQGLGIGYVADFEFVPHPRLRTVRISDAEIRTKYYLAFLTDRRDARLVKAFCDVALQVRTDREESQA